MTAAAIELHEVQKAFRRREREARTPWWRPTWKDKVALEPLGLPLDTLDERMKQLSRGQQQKVAIARSFLTAPSLLLLDEPTTGLDPRSKKEVQRLLDMLRKEREVTVLLCTHDMDEAAALCDRVLMMDGGRVLADGTPDELILAHGGGDPTATLEDVFMHLTGKRLDVEEEGGGEE